MKFENTSTELHLNEIGECIESKLPGCYIYYDAITVYGEPVTILSHGHYVPTTQFVKGMNGDKPFYVPIQTYHKIKNNQYPANQQAQDTKYTGGATPQPPAAEKPKDYPWAPKGSLAEGDHTHTIEVMAIAPQMKDGIHRSYTSPKSGNTSWKYDVLYVLDGLKRRATWESASQTDPMLAPGQHQMVITVKGDFASIKKPRQGGGFGGSAPADPVLTLLAAIVGNPSHSSASWADSLDKALALYHAKKGGPK